MLQPGLEPTSRVCITFVHIKMPNNLFLPHNQGTYLAESTTRRTLPVTWPKGESCHVHDADKTFRARRDF